MFIMFVLFSTKVVWNTRQDLLSFIPEADWFVLDQANILNKESQFETEIANLQSRTWFEIGIITTNDISKFTSIEEFSVLVYEKWWIGNKELDNWLLIVIVLTDSPQYRIEVWYWAEWVFTDGLTWFIQDQYMLPYFAKWDFDGGINAWLDAIIPIVENNKELHAPVEEINVIEQEYSVYYIIFVFILIALIVIVLAILWIISYKTNYKILTADVFWFIINLILQVLLSSREGSSSSWSRVFSGGSSGWGGSSRK